MVSHGKRSILARGDDVPTCQQCGQQHLTRYGTQACVGHVITDRNTYDPTKPRGKQRELLPEPIPCKASPRMGQGICSMHGAKTPKQLDAARRRESERKAAKALQRFGAPVDTTPSEALLDTVKWTAGYVGWLREKVAGEDEPIPPGETDDERRVRDERALIQRSTQTGKQEASAWVELLGTWHDKLVRVCAEAIRAGIEERRVRIAEQQGALVADVIRKILGDLDLTPEQASKAGEAVPRHLRLLAS